METQSRFILLATFCLFTSCGSDTTGSIATNCSGKGATMFFNNTCEMKYNHDKELLDIVMSFPVRGF